MSGSIRQGAIIVGVAAVLIAVGAWILGTSDPPLPPGPPPLTQAELLALPDQDLIARVNMDLVRRVYPRQATPDWLDRQTETVASVFVLAGTWDALQTCDMATLLAIQREVGGCISLETLGAAATAVGAKDLAKACASGDPAQIDRWKPDAEETLRLLRRYIRAHAGELVP